MKKLILLVLLLLVVTGELKNGVVVVETPPQYYLFSKENMIRLIYDLNIAHPDIVIAQAIIESGNFKSNIFKENNNLFGMKMPEYRKTTAIGTNRGHAVYSSWRESVIDYALWQGKRARYQNTNQYLRRLKSYAADPNYITKIKQRI
jgi:flagellum-specific peptidoglycan hydrolase FlgJ